MKLPEQVQRVTINGGVPQNVHLDILELQIKLNHLICYLDETAKEKECESKVNCERCGDAGCDNCLPY
jgi:hypothetical protein